MSKVVTDDLLKQVTTDIITSLAEHMVEYEAYTEDEILGLFNLTPEEAQQLSELIRDDIVSQYKLWSSNKVNNEITLTKTECNDYTDKMVAGLSNVKLLFANSLPSVGDDNTIYIHPQLQDDGSVIYTLNIWSIEDSDWVTFGNLNIDFSQYYKKDEVDELLALKADKTEILSQDNVIVDTTLATTANVLSATTTLNELDKKIDKDSIVTTLDDTVTDEQIVGASTLYNLLADKTLKSYIVPSIDKTGTDNPLGLTETTLSDVWAKLPKNSIVLLDSGLDATTYYGLPNRHFTIFWARIYANRDMIIATRTNTDNFYICTNVDNQTWKKVCTTSVADVPPTLITSFSDTNIMTINCNYCVENGWCHLVLEISIGAEKSYGWSAILDDTYEIPIPKLANNTTKMTLTSTDGDTLIIAPQNGSLYMCGDAKAKQYLGSISYPVLES